MDKEFIIRFHDNDTYLLPYNLKEQFEKDVDGLEQADMFYDEYDLKNQWHETYNKFNDEYSQYEVEGELSNYVFYVVRIEDKEK